MDEHQDAHEGPDPEEVNPEDSDHRVPPDLLELSVAIALHKEGVL